MSYTEQQNPRPKLHLTRGPDGRLRSSAGGGRLPAGMAGAPGMGKPKTGNDENSIQGRRRSFLSAAFKGRRRIVVFLAVALLFVAPGVFAANYFLKDNKNNTEAGKSVLAAGELHAEDPDFVTLLPKGKNIDELGGWVKVSPPGNDPAYAFVDYADGVRLNVTQQLMPQKIIRDTDEGIRRVAEQFGATDKLDLAELAIYIGTSARGPQSVVFGKQGLLVLIKSSAPLTDEQWASYTESLE